VRNLTPRQESANPMKLEREQFEKLAMEHLDMLYRIARRMTRDTATAEDLVQETFLRALRSRDSFELKEYGIRPWLLRIMHNLHVTRFKRERRQPMAIYEEQLQAMGDPVLLHSNPLPIDQFDGMDQQLVQAMENLPVDYQTVMLLWAVDELSYKDIAEAVDVPIGTVMSRLHRARQKLSEQLRTYAANEGIIRE
jgi:RNA polymerase sigma-70 factor (ECF subfamily)